MTLREAISESFDPKTWKSIEHHLSPPELLKMSCLIEFIADSNGPRIEFLRRSMHNLQSNGFVSLNEEMNKIYVKTRMDC
jgi:hypothetical protein